MIRIEIEGRRYDIPIRYAYWQAFQQRGYWPKVKPDRVTVGALSLSVLLPDMKPYYSEDEARWKARGQGDRDKLKRWTGSSDIATVISMGKINSQLAREKFMVWPFLSAKNIWMTSISPWMPPLN